MWLAKAGTNNWLVITRDKHIRTREGERESILRNGVGCFILTRKKAYGRWQTLKFLAAHLDRMVDHFDNAERPFIVMVDGQGVFRNWLKA